MNNTIKRKSCTEYGFCGLES